MELEPNTNIADEGETSFPLLTAWFAREVDLPGEFNLSILSSWVAWQCCNNRSFRGRKYSCLWISYALWVLKGFIIRFVAAFMPAGMKTTRNEQLSLLHRTICSWPPNVSLRHNGYGSCCLSNCRCERHWNKCDLEWNEVVEGGVGGNISETMSSVPENWISIVACTLLSP